jgi:hypothetical protein
MSATRGPGAQGACFVASWQLPRLDLHKLADGGLSGHSIGRWAAVRLRPDVGATLSARCYAQDSGDFEPHSLVLIVPYGLRH